jgi:putative autotransporter adhesin-like protein
VAAQMTWPTRKESTMTPRGRRQTRMIMVVGLVALSTTTLACDVLGTRGQGEVMSETRKTETFSRIESGAGIHVSVGIGAATPLEVHAQGNILPLIVTEVVDGTLRIRSSKGYTTTDKVEVTFATPELEGIVLSGGSRGSIDGLASDTFDVNLSGGSVLTATGTTGAMTLNISGGSVAEIDGLTATTIDVDLSGGSRADVTATDSVSGSATGGSRVSVAGGAAANVDTSGGSQVESR